MTTEPFLAVHVFGADVEINPIGKYMIPDHLNDTPTLVIIILNM